MRRAINDNPVVQAVLVGVMVILFAFLLFTRVLNRDSAAAPDATATTEAMATTPATGTESAAGATATPTPETATPGTAAPGAAAPGATAAPTSPAGAMPTGEFVPGKGLPRNVVEAYRDNKVVALLVVRERGIEDKPVKSAVESLRRRSDVEVFVTGAKDIARYSQITQGVNVSRVPALVVIRPMKLNGDVPEATVSYGFRSRRSVLQAVSDAKYDGRKVPYHPE
jgi:hypothetical protein